MDFWAEHRAVEKLADARGPPIIYSDVIITWFSQRFTINNGALR